MERAIIYCRTSTTKQDVSLEIQEETCRREASHLGFEIVDVVHEKVSGEKVSNRPGLNRVLNSLAQKEADVLLVYQLGRLSRDPMDLHTLCLDYKVRSVLDVIDTDTAFGKFVFRVQGAMLEFERLLIGERTSKGLQQRKKEGRKYTKTPPYGFRWEDNRLTKDPEEYLLLRLMFKLRFKHDFSYSRISSQIEAQGMSSRAGNKFDSSSIRRIMERSPDADQLVREFTPGASVSYLHET